MKKNNKTDLLNNRLWPSNFLFSDIFLQFIEPIPEAIIISNTGGTIVQVNQEACKIFGYTRLELLNLFIEDLVPDSIRSKHSQFRKLFFSNPKPRYMYSRDTLSFKHKLGHCVPMEAALFSLTTDEGMLAVNLIRNITEQKAYVDQLAEYGLFDELTSLHNRRFIMEELKIMLMQTHRRKENLAVLFIDIDNFKPINDIYGHDFGDALLIEIGKRLSNILRKSDFLGRLGGDEFCFILNPVFCKAGTRKVANVILSSLKQPIIVNNVSLNVSASIGIANTSEGFLEVKTILKAADIAMYKAKELGGDQFVFALANNDLEEE